MEIGGTAGEDQSEAQLYGEPGRMAATGGAKAPAFFVVAAEPLAYDRDDVAQQKSWSSRR